MIYNDVFWEIRNQIASKFASQFETVQLCIFLLVLYHPEPEIIKYPYSHSSQLISLSSPDSEAFMWIHVIHNYSYVVQISTDWSQYHLVIGYLQKGEHVTAPYLWGCMGHLPSYAAVTFPHFSVFSFGKDPHVTTLQFLHRLDSFVVQIHNERQWQGLPD